MHARAGVLALACAEPKIDKTALHHDGVRAKRLIRTVRPLQTLTIAISARALTPTPDHPDVRTILDLLLQTNG